MADALPSILTVDEVAEYLRIPVSSVYRLAQEGRIPSDKVGGRWRFHRETIDDWLGRSSDAPDEDGVRSNE